MLSSKEIISKVKGSGLRTIAEVNDFILEEDPDYYREHIWPFRYSIGEDKIIQEIINRTRETEHE